MQTRGHLTPACFNYQSGHLTIHLPPQLIEHALVGYGVSKALGEKVGPLLAAGMIGERAYHGQRVVIVLRADAAVAVLEALLAYARERQRYNSLSPGKRWAASLVERMQELVEAAASRYPWSAGPAEQIAAILDAHMRATL